jgi:hypothetical protein
MKEISWKYPINFLEIKEISWKYFHFSRRINTNIGLSS